MKINNIITLTTLISSFFLTFPAQAKKDTLTVLLRKESYTLFIHPTGSILSFPESPTELSTSTQSAFSIKQNGSDIIILPQRAKSKGRLFLYLGKKRLVLDLYTSTRARSIFRFIRPLEQSFTPEFK